MMDRDLIYDFLKEIDEDFPVNLSDKVNLDETANKYIERATIKYKLKDGSIIGMVAGYINNYETKEAYISLVGIRKNYRGNGIAKILLREFIYECKQKGFNKIFVDTYEENNIAMKLYRDEGFIVASQENNRIHLVYENKQ